MKLKLMLAIVVLHFVTGCKLIDSFNDVPEEQSNVPVVEVNQNQICLIDEIPGAKQPKHNCDLAHWLGYWIDKNQQPWLLRGPEIESLGESTSDLFKKVLLSQGEGTPYQDRLRAQMWAQQLRPRLSIGMNAVLEQLIYLPSQELLEYESALAILTRVNANQLQELEQQKALLLQQQQQIDAFLKIEASMIEESEEINE